ncbi:MAG: hypothetical protein AB4911_22215 [Oscillochloridaceae bacterium umkhey_bin13]
MANYNSTAARILTAQAHHCDQLASEIHAARAAGASVAAIADLEAQQEFAQRRYQELAVDMPQGGGSSTHAQGERRPWWRFW